MKFNQQQCEAFADILVLAMCIDGHFSLTEEKELQKEINRLDWDENLSPSLHISSSIARARDIIGLPEHVKIYLETLVPIIGDTQIANYILNETIKVLNSDGKTTEEGIFIGQLKAILGL